MTKARMQTPEKRLSACGSFYLYEHESGKIEKLKIRY